MAIVTAGSLGGYLDGQAVADAFADRGDGFAVTPCVQRMAAVGVSHVERAADAVRDQLGVHMRKSRTSQAVGEQTRNDAFRGPGPPAAPSLGTRRA